MLRLLINLDRSQDRLQVISKALTDLGLSFSRVQAIDGKKLTEEEVRQWTIPKAKRHFVLSGSYQDGDSLLLESSQMLANACRQ